jgi:hypothetical protein
MGTITARMKAETVTKKETNLLLMADRKWKSRIHLSNDDDDEEEGATANW